MAEIIKNIRILLKNGLEKDWNLVNDFIPGLGEVIIYNIDENHDAPRMKIGDGIHLPKDLPFINNGINNIPNGIAKRVEHKLTFGMNETYQFDGSEDVTIPVYTGDYNLN